VDLTSDVPVEAALDLIDVLGVPSVHEVASFVRYSFSCSIDKFSYFGFVLPDPHLKVA
jgi:hypothetical protein